eukprot:TRINITY_DN2076_c0_g1_i3.p1 TRINITY_DN2076_c0_g1~~TRINITY_DN2076_c0_g1_i3.p1  ORF type:complete len:154 (+),score=63.60 TRINITY_DN2076_c0_g1_i3:619-1080(+)
MHNHINIVKQLLRSNLLNLNITKYDGSTALHIACSNGNLEIVQLLLFGFNDNDNNNNNNSTIINNIINNNNNNNKNLDDLFIKNENNFKSNPFLKTRKGSNIFELAELNGHKQITSFIISNIPQLASITTLNSKSLSSLNHNSNSNIISAKFY